MADVRLKLSPPWVTYVNKLQALLDGDPLIAFNIDYGNEKGPIVVISVGNGDKVTALQKLLPTEKTFGNITLHIVVDGKPSNRAFATIKELFEVAFDKNPAFAYAISPVEEGYWYPNMTFVVFKNCVVQFFNDNLNDCHGIISTLYETIADEIFEDWKANYTGGGMVYFNTDVEVGNLGKPLGEWP